MQDLFAGADAAYRLPVRFLSPNAWHALFVRNMFIRPSAGRAGRVHPRLHGAATRRSSRPIRPATAPASSTFIVLNFAEADHPHRRHALRRRDEEVDLHGAQLSPAASRTCFPMHCSANIGTRRRRGGLLRALRHRQDHALGRPDPAPHRRRRARLERPRRVQLRGRLLRQGDPAERPRASRRSTPPRRCSAPCSRTWCSIPSTRSPDFDADTLTENTRASYPIDFIPNHEPGGIGGHPANIVFLTADAFGVLPADRAAHPATRRCTTSSRATRPRWRAPSAASPSRAPPSPPASARRSCPCIPASTPRCWARRSRSTAPRSGWSTPAGPAAPTASASRMKLGAHAHHGARGARRGSSTAADAPTDPVFGFEVPTARARRARPSVLDAAEHLDGSGGVRRAGGQAGRACSAKNFATFASRGGRPPCRRGPTGGLARARTLTLTAHAPRSSATRSGTTSGWTARRWRVLDTPAVQRLRYVRQLGHAFLVYPGATHSRFEHALGAYHLTSAPSRRSPSGASSTRSREEDRLAVRLAALLHDIGHYPFSHALEEAGFLSHEALGVAQLAQGELRRRAAVASGGRELAGRSRASSSAGGAPARSRASSPGRSTSTRSTT